MYNGRWTIDHGLKKLDELQRSLSKWEEDSLKKALNQLPERADEFITTSSEPINSQTFHLGIERPHLRNGSAIANLNTLIYTLINLRLFHRLRQLKNPAS